MDRLCVLYNGMVSKINSNIGDSNAVNNDNATPLAQQYFFFDMAVTITSASFGAFSSVEIGSTASEGERRRPSPSPLSRRSGTDGAGSVR